MSHGLCMFGPDERLIVCNPRYLEIYGLDPAVIKPGVTHRELLAHWIAKGNEPGMSAEAFYEKRKSAVTGQALSTMLLHLKDGRVIEATLAPDAGRRLGVGARGRHRAAALRGEAAGAEHPVRCRDRQHGAGAGHVRCRQPADRLQRQVRLLLQCGPGGDQARHHAARGVRARRRARHLSGADGRRAAGAPAGIAVESGSKSYDQKMADGRTLAVSISSMAKGGWVGTFSDVTEHARWRPNAPPLWSSCNSRTCCSTPHWRTWRTACACSTRTGA